MIMDFNCISSKDKWGGRSIGDCSKIILRSFMFNIGAINLEFTGTCYTWSNRRLRYANIRERQDCCICDYDIWLHRLLTITQLG